MLLLLCAFTSHQPLNSIIISGVKLLQTTHQLALWAAADNVGHRLSFATWTLCNYEAPLFQDAEVVY